MSLEPKRLPLTMPIRRQLAEPTNFHSVGQLSEDRRFDEVGRQKGKGDHHALIAVGAAALKFKKFSGLRRFGHL